MSPGLPVVSGQEAIRALQRIGYEVVRQRGSHLRLRCPQDPNRRPLTVPDHPTLKPGLLRRIIRDAELDVEEFVRPLGH